MPWNLSFQQANIAAEYLVDSALVRWQGTDCTADADANQISLGDARGFSASYTAHNLLQGWTIAGIEHHAVCDGLERITASYLYLGRHTLADHGDSGFIRYEYDLLGHLTQLTVSTTTADIDADSDQLQDAWDWVYFGGLHEAASGDPNLNGQTNLEELLARSDPATPITGQPRPPVTTGPIKNRKRLPASTGSKSPAHTLPEPSP